MNTTETMLEVPLASGMYRKEEEIGASLVYLETGVYQAGNAESHELLLGLSGAVAVRTPNEARILGPSDWMYVAKDEARSIVCQTRRARLARFQVPFHEGEDVRRRRMVGHLRALEGPLYEGPAPAAVRPSVPVPDANGRLLPGIEAVVGVSADLDGEVWGGDIFRLEAGFSFPPHTHEGCHLVLCMTGRGSMLLGDTQEPLHAGVCVFVPAGYAHAVQAGSFGALTIASVSVPYHRPDAAARMRMVEAFRGM